MEVSLKKTRAPGAGRPKGSGSKFGESTKVVRLPQSIANDVEGFVQKYQDLQRIIYQNRQELESRKHLVRAKEAYELISELVYILES